MASVPDLDGLRAKIDAAINPLGGDPKITGPALNGLLHTLADALPDAATATAAAGVQQVASAAALPSPPPVAEGLYLTLDTGHLYRWDAPTAAYVDLAAGLGAALADKLSLGEPGSQTVHSELVLENGGVDTLKFYDGDLEGTAYTRLGWRATDGGAAVDVGLMRQQAGSLKVVGTGTEDYARLEAADVVAHQAPDSLNSIAKLAAAFQAGATVRKSTREKLPYDTAKQALLAATAGDLVSLEAALTAAECNVTNEMLNVPSGVSVNLYAPVTRTSLTTDILTLRGGKGVLNGFHTTFTDGTTGDYRNWLIGNYPNDPVDYTINDLDLVTGQTNGIYLWGPGTIRYRGNVTVTNGSATLRVNGSQQPAHFYGQGTMVQQGGDLIRVEAALAYFDWQGDLTADGTATLRLLNGTLCLRQGTLRAQNRPAGAEQLIVHEQPTAKVILENYTVLGIPGTTAISAGTVILRGSSVVVGNIVADTLIDERPTGSSTSAGRPAAPAAFTLPDGVVERVAQFVPTSARNVQAYETTQDGGTTWQPATTPKVPVPLAGVAAGIIGVRVAATADGVPASAPTYLPATGAVSYQLGLRARYYEGFLGWTPDFSLFDKAPLFEEVVEHAARFRDPFFDNYAQVSKSLDIFSIRFDSYLHIKEAGQYSFGSSADDIGVLWVGEAVHQPLTLATRADNTGQSYYLEVGMHPICLAFSEYAGGQTADYYWNGPGVSDIINAGRLCLLTNSPVPADTQRAPAGLLLDPDFDQEMSATTWSPARGWDIVNGVLLGTDTAETITTLTLPTAALQDPYTIEVSIEITGEAHFIVDCNGLTISNNMLTTSGVHRLPATATTENINIRLRAENSTLVKVHYAQLIHG